MSVNHDALQDRTRGARAALWRLAGPWWLLLLTGIAWLILSWVALRFTPASVATVGILLGVLFLFGMVDEFLLAAIGVSWRWLHVIMAVIFAFGAGWSFARPYNAFWTLASILGLLLIFRGALDIISSLDARAINSAWWLGMVAGILEILLGFWASQQYRSVQGALLLVWVGFFALFRGISEIVIAFEVRSRQRA